jgi:hypothetical protein
VTAAVTTYLIDVSTPPEGTVCPQDFVPFTLSAAAAADSSQPRAARQAVNRIFLESVLRRLPQ